MRKFQSVAVTLCAVIIGAVASVGCDTSDDPAAQPDARAPLGKADLLDGSCFELGHIDHCGGQSAGSCWCDESCAEFGDCCGDALWCEPTGGLPCGGILSGACPEDFACVADSGDCNPEETTSCPGTCEPIPDSTGAPCGGFVSEACPDGLECVLLPDGDCDPEQTNSCPGTCEPEAAEETPCGGLFTEACPGAKECIPEPGCDPAETNSCPGTCQ